MPNYKRYATLDGMRGVAALSIVCWHGQPVFGAATPRSAYLAVDFFFVLSGFIMAHVYGGALDGGMTGWAFMRARIIRLYPLYILGSISAVAMATFSLLRHSTALWDFTQPQISFPFAVFMLPSPGSSAWFPLNIPAWSLALELIANVVFAVGWLRRGPPMLVLICVSAAALAVASVTCGGLDLGWDKQNGAWGLARVFFSFPLGVLLYRVHRRIRLPSVFKPGAASIVPILMLVALLFAHPTGNARIAFDLGFVFVASPALLLAAAASNPTGHRLTSAYLLLGTISYPLYILHHPTLEATIGTISRHVPEGPATIAAACLLLAALVVVARYAAILDGRLHAAITRRLRQSTRQVEPALL